MSCITFFLFSQLNFDYKMPTREEMQAFFDNYPKIKRQRQALEQKLGSKHSKGEVQLRAVFKQTEMANFSDLPRELRDSVYYLVLKCGARKLELDNCPGAMEYFKAIDELITQSLFGDQVRKEAEEVFYLHPQFAILVDESGSTHPWWRPSIVDVTRVRNLTFRSESKELDRSSLRPRQHKEVTIHLTTRTMPPSCTTAWEGYWDPQMRDRTSEIVERFGSKLRNIVAAKDEGQGLTEADVDSLGATLRCQYSQMHMINVVRGIQLG